MKEFEARVGRLGIMDKVRINMIQHWCTCNNDLTDIHELIQHEFMDSDNTKSTSEINATYEELTYKKN